ncbi:ABC transporter G family member E23 isoform X2 [Musca autumnalis]|uniref:ABC transporter G family member E23 isoform X2 n=1 Tax=Musca autumnalis TaxID=221902 RepID=UPI003CF9339E
MTHLYICMRNVAVPQCLRSKSVRISTLLGVVMDEDDGVPLSLKQQNMSKIVHYRNKKSFEVSDCCKATKYSSSFRSSYILKEPDVPIQHSIDDINEKSKLKQSKHTDERTVLSKDLYKNMNQTVIGDSINNVGRDQMTLAMSFPSEPHRTLYLSFQNITVLHNDRKILDNVSGTACPGEILAVMGPSGSGKTTLLDCLSSQRRISNPGRICVNGEPLSKKWRRKICYVLQEEIFFPSLTLRETVTYAALLRLPEKMPKVEKIAVVDSIIDSLELNSCQHTKFGDYMNRGLSGGEKRRANIACELLTNPLLMLLDEPTSGLDSHAAISLMKILKRYAIQEQKTVVITVHQPSSEMFRMFDKLLLLYDGCTAYFGGVNNINEYFQDIGVAIKPHYNPAEFVLEQLKSNPDTREKLFVAARESYSNILNHNCLGQNDVINTNEIHRICPLGMTCKEDNHHNLFINNFIQNYYNDVHKNSNHLPAEENNSHLNLHMESCQIRCEEAAQKLCPNKFQLDTCVMVVDNQDWLDYPTKFHTQFRVLSNRNFKEAKSRMLSKLNWFQTIGLSLMTGAIWFDIPRTEENLHDLQGWMFFSQTYWMLFALFGALNSFPSEREVINKERRSGSYRLSAYYLAKMFGELPLVVTLPTVYLLISYSLLGCSSIKLFLLMLVFLLLNTVVAQSVGFFIGACCMDMNVSITLSALYTLATQLFGGFLSTRIPDFLSWIRYTSMIHYAYQNMQILEFREGPPILCKQPSSYEACATSDIIPYEDILRSQNYTTPLWFNTLVLLLFLVLFRCLGYTVLRYIRCPQT